MTVTPGVYYSCKQKHTGRVLDGNDEGKVYNILWNGGDYQKWLFEDVGGGYYKIKQKHTGRVLDGNDEGKAYTIPWNGGDYQKWELEDVGDGYYKIKQKHTGRVLDGDAKGKAYNIEWNGGDYQKWKLEVVAGKWYVAEGSIVYDKTSPPTGGEHPLDMGGRKVWRNASPATIREKIEFSLKKTKRFTWGLTQSLNVGTKLKLEVKLPEIASASAELSIDLGLEARQEWSEEKEETYSVAQEIELAERAAIEVHAYLDWVAEFETPFTLKMRVWATAHSTDGPNHRLSGAQLTSLLNEAGFSGTIIDELTDESGFPVLLVSLRGNYTGSFGLDTYVDINEIPFDEAPADAITKS